MFNEGRNFRINHWQAQFDKALSDAANSGITDREVYGHEAINLTPLFMVSVQKRFPKAASYHEDIASDMSIEYYKRRCEGHEPLPLAKKSFSAWGGAKKKAFKTWMIYTGIQRKYWRAYKQKDECDCSECYRGRVYNCLNGTFNIKPVELVDLFAPVGGIDGGPLLIEILKPDPKNKYRDLEFLKVQIRCLFSVCKCTTDRRVIARRLKGQTNVRIGRDLGVSEQATRKRAIKIIGRFHQA